jgi:hypothetical protein
VLEALTSSHVVIGLVGIDRLLVTLDETVHRLGAISVGTVPVIAIPLAANPGPVAAIAGRTADPRCNQSGHEPPMIAIPATGYCGSLQVIADPLRRRTPRH